MAEIPRVNDIICHHPEDLSQFTCRRTRPFVSGCQGNYKISFSIRRPEMLRRHVHDVDHFDYARYSDSDRHVGSSRRPGPSPSGRRWPRASHLSCLTGLASRVTVTSRVHGGIAGRIGQQIQLTRTQAAAARRTYRAAASDSELPTVAVRVGHGHSD